MKEKPTACQEGKQQHLTELPRLTQSAAVYLPTYAFTPAPPLEMTIVLLIPKITSARNISRGIKVGVETAAAVEFSCIHAAVSSSSSQSPTLGN